MLKAYNFDRLWNMVKRSPLGRFVQSEKDLPLAMDAARYPDIFGGIGRHILREDPHPAFLGARYDDESRRFLIPTSFTAGDWHTAPGDMDVFPVHDFLTVLAIGGVYTTAGTTTAVRMEIDRRPTQGSDTSRVNMLDGTNGYWIAPSAAASQALGAVVYKRLAQTAPVDIEPGDELVGQLVTACSVGNGRNIVIVVPRAKLWADGTLTFESA